MDELVLIAATEAEVVGAIGSARVDAEQAHAWETRALACGEPLPGLNADPLVLSVPTLLRHPDPALPLDGPPDGYWIALATLAVVASRDCVVCSGVGSLHDLDQILATAEVGAGVGLLRASHHPSVPFELGDDVDVRVVPAQVASAFARAWLDSAPSDSHASLTAFCRRYLVLPSDPARPAPDLFAVVPPVAIGVDGPVAPWPLTALPRPEAHPSLLELAGESDVVAAVVAGHEELESRFDRTEGLYVRGGWRLEWRFDDGLARVTSPGPQGPPQRTYGRLTPGWGAAFDAALRAVDFPAPPSGVGTWATLTLGTRSVPVPAAAATGEWSEVVSLLEGIVGTLVPGSAGNDPRPEWVVPL